MPDSVPPVPPPLTLLDAVDGRVGFTLVSLPARDAIVGREAARHLTSVHTWDLVAELGRWEQFCPRPPRSRRSGWPTLDEKGRVRVGTAVAPGDILVAKEHAPAAGLVPPSAETEEGDSDGDVESAPSPRDGAQDRSLRCPPHVKGLVTKVEVGKSKVTVSVRIERPLAVGDVLRTTQGEWAAVGSIVDHALGADLAWPNVGGSRDVQKMVTAEGWLQARSVGPYALVTQQPLRGKPHQGGQPVGSLLLAALLDRGASVIAHELQTVKSDDVRGRRHLYRSILAGKPECHASIPVGTRMLEAELRALGFQVDLLANRPQLELLTTARIRAVAPGEVTKPETLNYRTFLPEPQGLFCTQIFGALHGDDRRHRLGRVEFPIPLLPPDARPAVATLLQLDAAGLECILFNKGEGESQTFELGGRILRDRLSLLDRDDLATRDDARGRVALALKEAGLSPMDLLVEAWPVLPPDLRPLIPLTGGRFATSDLNDLYRRLINRKNRLSRLLELNAPAVILVNEAVMLQQALDSLVHNGRWSRLVTGPNTRPLSSLTPMIGGPRGRFALLAYGKRVDYSGLANVVENAAVPEGKARLPREMALEMWKPWVVGGLTRHGHAPTVREAKRLIDARAPVALEELERVVSDCPVLVTPEGDSPKVLSLDVELWDEAAIALPAITIGRLDLAPGMSLAVHVPVDPLAIEEARSQLRGVTEVRVAHVDRGWLTRATEAPLDQVGSVLFQAALHREQDAVTSRLARLILGRLV